MSNHVATGPAACPRFDTCSAPICPLDSGWRLRVMLKDEPVCRYIRAAHRGESTEAEKAGVSLAVVAEQAAAHSYVANKLAKEAARREREVIPHPTFEAIELEATRPCQTPIHLPCTPRFPGAHPTPGAGTLEAYQ